MWSDENICQKGAQLKKIQNYCMTPVFVPFSISCKNVSASLISSLHKSHYSTDAWLQKGLLLSISINTGHQSNSVKGSGLIKVPSRSPETAMTESGGHHVLATTILISPLGLKTHFISYGLDCFSCTLFPFWKCRCECWPQYSAAYIWIAQCHKIYAWQNSLPHCL